MNSKFSRIRDLAESWLGRKTRKSKRRPSKKMFRPFVEFMEERVVPTTPIISSVSPASGPVTGGTSVLLSGTNLSQVSTIQFGSAAPVTPLLAPSTSLAMRVGGGGTVTAGGVPPVTFAPVNSLPNLTVVAPTGSVNETHSQTFTLSPALDWSAFPNCQTLFNGDAWDYSLITCTASGLQPGCSYKVSLFFAEFTGDTTGQRVFNVTMNNSPTPWLPNFDIYAQAGGENIGIYRQTAATANAAGQLTIKLSNMAGSPILSGILIQNDPTTMVVTTPPKLDGGGPVSIVAHSAGPDVTALTPFNYQPVVTGVSPPSDSLTPISNLIITGNGFTTAQAVQIGNANVNLAPSNINSDTQITIPAANLPNGLAATGSPSGGVVPVLVYAGGVQSVINGTYTYVGPPTISSISPPSGSVAGGTNVTITGTNFNLITGVTFGGVPVTGTFSSQSTLAINCGNTGAQGPFTADQDYTAGANGKTQAVTVVPPAVAALFPSGTTASQEQAIMSSTRYDGTATAGNGFYYTIPGLVAGSSCTVTLFFSEQWWGPPGSGMPGVGGTGSRVFSVFVNNSATPQISNYDIYATALAAYGQGYNCATAQQFTATAQADGTLKLNFVTVNGQALCAAIMDTGNFTANNTTLVVTTPPSVTGPGPVNVTVTNQFNESATAPGGFTYLGITPTTLPNGTVGPPVGPVYPTQTMTMAGAVGTVTYQVTAGTAPPGLSLTTAAGVTTFGGSPTEAGSFSFTITGTDQATPPNVVPQNYTVAIQPGITTAGPMEGKSLTAPPAITLAGAFGTDATPGNTTVIFTNASGPGSATATPSNVTVNPSTGVGTLVVTPPPASVCLGPPLRARPSSA